MNKQELIQKLQDIEWEDFEVKEAMREVPKNSWETASAFANTAGGWLIFGVKKTGKNFEVVGVEHPENIERDFLTALRGEKFNNKIPSTAKKYDINGKTVLGFYIPSAEAKAKPVYFNSLSKPPTSVGGGAWGRRPHTYCCPPTKLVVELFHGGEISSFTS